MPEEEGNPSTRDLTSYSGEFMKFLSTLASATGDLSSMTCPAFLLNGYSLLEYSQHWGDHPDLLHDLSKAHLSKEERMLAVMTWFISTLHGSYRSRCETSSERKPFNPVLGETFRATWKDDQNMGWKESSIIVEQVSHHPPVSAFVVQMPSSGSGSPSIIVQGHCGQKTTFNTTQIIVKQVGRVQLSVTTSQGEEEVYTIYPLPELSVSGLLSMSVFVELLGKTKITCSNGAEAELEYVPVGWFTGEHFTVKGHVKESASGKPYCTLSGKWTEQVNVTLNGETKSLFNVKEQQPYPRSVPDLEKQVETESLKLWGPVVQQLKKGDFAKASELKTAIEEHQRSLRKERIASGESFTPKFFSFIQPADNDKLGTTKRDPQHTGGEKTEETGHWIYNNTLFN